MKILIAKYMLGEARFVLEGFPDTTICIDLKGKTTQKQITDELKARLPTADTTEQIFNDLNLSDLEGTDI